MTPMVRWLTGLLQKVTRTVSYTSNLFRKTSTFCGSFKVMNSYLTPHTMNVHWHTHTFFWAGVRERAGAAEEGEGSEPQRLSRQHFWRQLYNTTKTIQHAAEHQWPTAGCWKTTTGHVECGCIKNDWRDDGDRSDIDPLSKGGSIHNTCYLFLKKSLKSFFKHTCLLSLSNAWHKKKKENKGKKLISLHIRNNW